jgi:CelD/BcsL family acetyltransferase involved in cellulose biosynthesis
MLSLRIDIARSASEMDRIAPLWNHLLKFQPHTVFQGFSWNRLAAAMFGDRLVPYVVWAESDSGAAIIPAALNRTEDCLEFLGEALFDYRDVLSSGDGELLRLAWQELAACGRRLRVVAIERPEPRWREFPVALFTKAPLVDCALTDEGAFRVAHSRLGRQMRRLQRLGVSLRAYSGSDSGAVRRLYDCKRNHFATDAGNLFTDQRRCDFMVAAAALQGERCKLFTLEQDEGTLIAGLVTFRDGNTRRFYTIYFHPEWARYSPGVALVYEATARSLAEGLSCDYMTGEYPYKLRLANASRPLYKVEAGAEELAQIAARTVPSAA